MRLQHLFEDRTTETTAFQQGREAARSWSASHHIHHGKQQPENPHKPNTSEHNAWREGFKHELVATPQPD